MVGFPGVSGAPAPLPADVTCLCSVSDMFCSCPVGASVEVGLVGFRLVPVWSRFGFGLCVSQYEARASVPQVRQGRWNPGVGFMCFLFFV